MQSYLFSLNLVKICGGYEKNKYYVIKPEFYAVGKKADWNGLGMKPQIIMITMGKRKNSNLSTPHLCPLGLPQK